MTPPEGSTYYYDKEQFGEFTFDEHTDNLDAGGGFLIAGERLNGYIAFPRIRYNNMGKINRAKESTLQKEIGLTRMFLKNPGEIITLKTISDNVFLEPVDYRVLHKYIERVNSAFKTGNLPLEITTVFKIGYSLAYTEPPAEQDF